MKTIYFIRHAKAKKDDEAQEDKERGLSKKGIEDAKLMKKMVKNRLHPQIVYSSSAKRAKESAKILFSSGTKVEYFDELYTFEKDSLKSFIENIDDNLKSIAIVGHNNAITAVCEELSDSAIGNLPTCGIFAIRFDVASFKELFEKEGEILYYCYPKMFKKE